MKIGDALPDMEVAATGDKMLNLASLNSDATIVYFYPKDSTPGCTTEGQNFRDNYAQFKKLGADIFGVSRDSIKSHENFKSKQDLPFDLISDPEETLCKAFDVIKLKKLYGREYLGIERSTFLFDRDGKLVSEWRKIKVKGHVDEVLEAVKQL